MGYFEAGSIEISLAGLHRFGYYPDIPIPITGVCVRNWNTESDGNGLQGGIR